jgi:hypothetical protein
LDRAHAKNLRAFCVPPSPDEQQQHESQDPASRHTEGSYSGHRGYVDFPAHNLTELSFDKVLIDGPARVACALRILPQLKKSSIVLLHDFFLRPDHYSRVLDYYDEVARIIVHGPVSTDHPGTPFGLLVIRPRLNYDQDGDSGLPPSMPNISPASIDQWYAEFIGPHDSEERASMDAAFQFISDTNSSGYPKVEHTRLMCRRASLLRILLDLIALPLLIGSYYLCYHFYTLLIAESIFGSWNSAKRLPETSADVPSASSSSSSGSGRSDSAPRSSDALMQEKLE